MIGELVIMNWRQEQMIRDLQAENDVLKQECRELEQQRDALRAELDRRVAVLEAALWDRDTR